MTSRTCEQSGRSGDIIDISIARCGIGCRFDIVAKSGKVGLDSENADQRRGKLTLISAVVDSSDAAQILVESTHVN
jgi:hypothetical protein